ncbi:hypothetical protein CfE428DRAFT_1371 [Chthoniobacter flavus Ellin428]|uniref:Uncharacterized protein n=1 Tax=Chthoniobacter flavus Ellin428 TaxID=497964 RepID=B4CXT0_9BACT|nr:hypothetical protein [Chthoniobacter flavus]EDY21078.1 hypothetical protein CfE428DRAFT_1371 [Chthoniobacter flavus Ellin428]TCO88800.1 hypothetical protein EV701_116172 [Chthoniobacter flavus]
MKKLVCVSSYSSGLKHRFALLNQVRNFGHLHGYDVHFLWGVSRGVAYCHWEELFGPLEGIRVTNVSEAEVDRIGRLQKAAPLIEYEGERLDVVSDGCPLTDRMFAFNLPATDYLERLVPNSARPKMRLLAPPNDAIRVSVDALARKHRLAQRTGIRVRVTEAAHDPRKPHRNKAELDQCLVPLLRLPADMPAFIVTDSEYVQCRLATHFVDAVWLPKEFDLTENGSHYVHRSDKAAMFTFLKEAFCLCACRRVINIGGFLNDQAACVWLPPYQETPAPLTALAV